MTTLTRSQVLHFTALLLLAVPPTVHPKRTTAPPAKWGEWGPWGEQCSQTCGIGVYRRTRECIYKVTSKKKKGKACKGASGDLKNCDTLVTCPVHGGWGTWAAWECTATCGGGVGKQSRDCSNPEPRFGGKECEGDKVEIGRCNVQPCPDQVYTLSPATANALKSSIEKGHYNFEKKQGETVKVPCRPEVLNSIYKEYPESVLSWIKNGAVLPLDTERMTMTMSELTIRRLQPEDNGVYVCGVRYAPEVVKPVAVAAVTVISSKPNVFVHAGEKMVFSCNGAYLAAIYGNLTQSWIHNTIEVDGFGKGLDGSGSGNKHEVSDVTANMTGTWACRVKDQSGRTWITNVLLLKVLPPMKLHHKLLSNTNLLLAAVIVVLVIVVAAGTYLTYVVQRTREEFMLDFEKWCVIAKLEGRKAGGPPEWAMDTQVDWYVTDESNVQLDDSGEESDTSDDEFT